MLRTLLLLASSAGAGALQLHSALPRHHARRSVRMAKGGTDFDLIIIGCGVGGHGAALHAVSRGLKVAVCAGKDVGGTCVNRGCVPSKALLAAAGRVREMQNAEHLASLGITAGDVSYDREAVAAHANNLASRVRGNLEGSLKALGVEVFPEKGSLVGPTEVELVGASKTIKAKDVMLATGSVRLPAHTARRAARRHVAAHEAVPRSAQVPFVPPGITTDGKTVFTSDEVRNLPGDAT